MWSRLMRMSILLLLGLSVLFLVGAADQVKRVTLSVNGLKQPVEILRDRWGVPHIYAQNQNDLFFAQGYITAKDRLFQLDLWRRVGTGKISEVLGPNYVARDRIAKLVQYRGNWEQEWKSYAPDAKQIVTAFTNGINAYIHSLHGERPEEFQLAGFDPGLWTPEDVVSRVPGLSMTGNMLGEVNRALQVSRLGLKTVRLLSPPDPPTEFAVPRGLDLGDISSAIVRDYVNAIGPLRFPGQQGSNNWVVDGTMSRTGKPILANDPHRGLTLPSLRKTVHLVAPGWDAIGAGDPALPGISLGHNEDIAFGFTLVGIDQQDLYVEKVDPNDPSKYLYKGTWCDFKIDHDTINVKESESGATEIVPRQVELKYTVHGPVIYEDTARHRAYALKWVGQMPGSAGYLPGLSLARAKDWQQFQSAAARFKVPSENLAYADRRGNIGWIASGLAPIRRGWEGLFPVPGDTGEYEWEGYLAFKDHPSEFNPPDHYIATANNNILPEHYPHELSYYWASPERYQRIVEMLSRKKKFDVDDFELMQQDTVSLVARDFVELLRLWHPAPGSREDQIRAQLLDWDCNLRMNSKSALIYEVWHARLSAKLTAKVLPAPRIHPREVMQSLRTNPELDELLSSSFDEALAIIERHLGTDESRWTWGNLHKAVFRHPLLLQTPLEPAGGLQAFGHGSDAARRQHLLDSLGVPPVSRPGDANTVNATGGGPNFTEAYGATYRQIIDVQNWDRSVMTNAPGESGDPESKHYDDLVVPWAKGEYHPMPFSRKAVEAATEEQILLKPTI